MKNLFKGADSMFAFSNVKNTNDNIHSNKKLKANHNYLSCETEHVNTGGSFLLTKRRTEFYD